MLHICFFYFVTLNSTENSFNILVYTEALILLAMHIREKNNAGQWQNHRCFTCNLLVVTTGNGQWLLDSQSLSNTCIEMRNKLVFFFISVVEHNLKACDMSASDTDGKKMFAIRWALFCPRRLNAVENFTLLHPLLRVECTKDEYRFLFTSSHTALIRPLFKSYTENDFWLFIPLCITLTRENITFR